MTTAFKAVQDAIVAALKAAPAIVGTRVVAGRSRPMPEEHASDIAVSIESVRSTGQQLTSHPVRWEVVYGIEIRARGSATTDAVAAVDPLLEKVYERFYDVAPPTGVAAWMLDPAIRYSVEEGATPVASVLLAVNVQLATTNDSLTLAT